MSDSDGFLPGLAIGAIAVMVFAISCTDEVSAKAISGSIADCAPHGGIKRVAQRFGTDNDDWTATCQDGVEVKRSP